MSVREAPLTQSDVAFEQIQTAIVRGELPAGQKISEAELCSRFGIGRGPVREAIRRLEGRGLVVRRPHAGASIVNLTYERLIELYQVREALEGMAARLAAEVASPEDVADLRALLEQHRIQIDEDDGKAYYQREGDVDFHYRIVRASGNETLYRVLDGELYHLLRLYRYKLSTQRGRPEKALREHLHIVEAISDGDGELAELLMRRHISAARRHLEQRFKNNELNFQEG
ncbi:MAG: GntR family transcriptional regulator [Gammaproteobacteria bacterium]|nr:MAG: GntR family transcriptional regulator [Gammaproteobacteria bacterium]